MTVVSTVTGELVETIGADEARRLTTEAQNEFRSSRDHFDRGWSLIEAAVTGGGHFDLGYRSPGDYLRAEFDGVLSGLDVTERRLAVRGLDSLGVSKRAAAEVLGVSHVQITKDRHAIAGGNRVTTSPTPAPEEGEADGAGPHVSADPADEPEGEDAPEDVNLGSEQGRRQAAAPRPPVIGIDGKTYTRPEPKPTPKPERSGEQQNAEENSRTLASSLIFLLAFQHPNQRDTARTEWEVGRWSVPPTNREYVTPDRMRLAARGLLELADEWENTHE